MSTPHGVSNHKEIKCTRAVFRAIHVGHVIWVRKKDNVRSRMVVRAEYFLVPQHTFAKKRGQGVLWCNSLDNVLLPR